MILDNEKDFLSLLYEISGYPSWGFSDSLPFDYTAPLRLPFLSFLEGDMTLDHADRRKAMDDFIAKYKLGKIVRLRTGTLRGDNFSYLIIYPENARKGQTPTPQDLKQTIESLRDKGDEFKNAVAQTLLQMEANWALDNLTAHGKKNGLLNETQVDLLERLRSTANTLQSGTTSDGFITTQDFIDWLIETAREDRIGETALDVNQGLDDFAKIVPALAPAITERRKLSESRADPKMSIKSAESTP